MSTIVDQRQAIADEFAAEISGLDSSVFGGELTLDDINRYAVKAPATRVGCTGINEALFMAGQPTYDLEWVVVIVARGTPTARGAQILSLAERIVSIVLGNDWGLDCQAPTRVAARNLFSGDIDRNGLAVWAVTWHQKLEAQSYDDSELADFNTLWAKYDVAPIDGVLEAEDKIELRGTWMSAYGQITIDTAAATSCIAADTYYKLAGTTELGDAEDVDMPVNGRLRHTGTVSKPFAVSGAVSLLPDADAKLTLALAKNGTVDTDTEIEIDVTNGKVEAVPLKDIVSLDENEYVEIWLKSDGSVNVTATKLSLLALAN